MHFRPKLAFMTPSGRLELEWERVPIDDTGVDVSLNERVCEGRTTSSTSSSAIDLGMRHQGCDG